MEIRGKFKNGTVIVSSLKTEDDEYKCHFGFDITISSPTIEYTYHFGEAVYFSMYDFLDRKTTKLIDENSTNNYLELTNKSLAIKLNQDDITASIQLHLNIFEDQEVLADFLLEFKAYCEYLMK